MVDDYDQLRDTLDRGFLEARSAPWDILKQAGVIGLCVPEGYGGLGLAVRAAEAVFDTIGTHRIATSYLDTAIIGVTLLLTGEGDARNALLHRIAGGDTQVAIAGIDRRLRGGVSASPTASGWRLDGDAKLVLDAACADAILVAARSEGGATRLFLVTQDAVGLSGRSYPTIDGRSASDLQFVAVDAVLIAANAEEALDKACDEANACLAIEAAALMRRLVNDTVAYTKEREQFGQPLARFQVIQHRLVDMHMQAKRCGAIARRAMTALDADWRERGRLASAAKATAIEAGRFVGQQAVQLHGGMGMSEGLPIGRYFKRLTAIETELGSADDHRRRYARLAHADAE